MKKMSKWIVAILVAGMVLGAGAAYAFNPDGELPSVGDEVPVWKWGDPIANQWNALVKASNQSDAKCFAQDSAEGICNKELWTLNVTNHASVAQWIVWTISAKNWKWFVRKPGTYTADCITAMVRSNYDVFINYADFGDLMYQDTGGVTLNIPTYYAFETTTEPPAKGDFIRADALNADDDTIVDSEQLHSGITWKLWNMIEVLQSNSACEYHDAAIIYISLLGIKNWIDPLTGYFDRT